MERFRCFESICIDLSNITLLVGENNSGKSSILRSILLMQEGTTAIAADVRAGDLHAKLVISCTDVKDVQRRALPPSLDLDIVLDIITDMPRNSVNSEMSISYDGLRQVIGQFLHREPYNCLTPFLSRRKVPQYSEDVRAGHAQIVGDMTFLAAKLARITNVGYPGHEAYRKSCESILGFMLTAVSSDSGQLPGIFLGDGSKLTVREMGEGVPNIATLLLELATARDKIFIIEEPENDLHPKSLKALLELVISSSEHNQFIISTHSNIVLQYLGAAPNITYYVERSASSIPTSTASRIPDDSQSRLEILRDLGYALSDFDLWDGWLILEESSAERIIRDFLIPIFAPRLANVRTLAASGVDDVEATFHDFHRLVKFTHLEEIYRHNTWIRVDGDDAGKNVVNKLRTSYSTWSDEKFDYFQQGQFEYYYPKIFVNQVEQVLKIHDRKEKRRAKKALLENVISWLREDMGRAELALSESAGEVIDFLQHVERNMTLTRSDWDVDNSAVRNNATANSAAPPSSV